MTPAQIRALYERAFSASDAEVLNLIRDYDSLRAQVASLTAERGALADKFSKSDYWLRTIRQTREEEQAERRAYRTRAEAAEATLRAAREAFAKWRPSQPLRDLLAAAYVLGATDAADVAARLAADRSPVLPEGL